MTDFRRGVKPEAAVTLFGVVPAKEIDAVRVDVFKQAEAYEKNCMILGVSTYAFGYGLSYDA